MSEKVHVKAGERGLIWVYSVDLEGKALEAFNRRNGSWPVQTSLRTAALNPDHVQVFPVKDLEGFGLTGFLTEGMGVPEDQISDLRAKLDSVEGTVLVLSSKAFDGAAAEFSPRHPLRLLAAFSEDRPLVAFDPLRSEAATGDLSPQTDLPTTKNKSAARGLIWLLALVAILGAVLWVML